MTNEEFQTIVLSELKALREDMSGVINLEEFHLQKIKSFQNIKLRISKGG
jgi:hypothetical protein